MQAGGRRFDPDQLHQFRRGEAEGRAKRKEAFSSDLWIGAEKVSELFNKTEEVKRLARKERDYARA